jgi:hypothetical protein
VTRLGRKWFFFFYCFAKNIKNKNMTQHCLDFSFIFISLKCYNVKSSGEFLNKRILKIRKNISIEIGEKNSNFVLN